MPPKRKKQATLAPSDIGQSLTSLDDSDTPLKIEKQTKSVRCPVARRTKLSAKTKVIGSDKLKRFKSETVSNVDSNKADLIERDTEDIQIKGKAGQKSPELYQMSKEWMTRAAIGLKSAQIVLKAAESSKFIGAHVSVAKGLDKSPLTAADSGCKAFGLFLRSQRTWKLNPADLTNDSKFAQFRKNCDEMSILPKHILPHGSYLLNAGSSDKQTLDKTRQTLLHEVQMCEKLGLPLYNFHPGSSCGKISTDECLRLIAESVNWVISQTSNVVIVLETMAKQGFTVGGSFEELKAIIDLIEDKTRVGVCLDTCHIFAAGYDIRNKEGYEKTMADFDRIVGLKYLKAVHLNDSKSKLGSKVDRHANICKGELGEECFRMIMKDKRLDDLPLILETPLDIPDADEIALLHSL